MRKTKLRILIVVAVAMAAVASGCQTPAEYACNQYGDCYRQDNPSGGSW